MWRSWSRQLLLRRADTGREGKTGGREEDKKKKRRKEMTERDLDKELEAILVLKEKLPEEIQQAIEISDSVPDILATNNKFCFVYSREGTDVPSKGIQELVLRKRCKARRGKT